MFERGMMSNDPSALAGFFLGIVVIYLLVILTMFVCYIIKGIGLYKLAEDKKLSGAWLAFIPLFSNYLIGKITGDVKLGNKTLKQTKWWMLLLPIAFISVLIPIMKIVYNYLPDGSAIPLLIFLYILYLVLIFTYVFFRFIVYYNLFRDYKNQDSAILSTALSTFIPFAFQIAVFRMKNLKSLSYQALDDDFEMKDTYVEDTADVVEAENIEPVVEEEKVEESVKTEYEASEEEKKEEDQ